MIEPATELVVGDIGGTNARFALASIGGDGTIALGEPETLSAARFANLERAWAAFAANQPHPLPNAASLAVAAPVTGGITQFTNSPWSIDPARLPGALGVERLTLLNDFAAVAHCAARADEALFTRLAGPDAPLPATGTISVIGPGTGLGVAYFHRDGKGGYHVQPTEGGHMDFGPIDAIDDAILTRLRRRHRRVSSERVASGPGIVEIYHTLAEREGKAVMEHDDRTLWRLGLSGEDSLASAAIDRFCLSLGSVAGDLALAHGASAVVIAGGLGYRIRERLAASGFAQRFRAKGRYEGMMAAMPVKLITHPQPGLFGAAVAFAMEHAQP